VPQKVLIRFEVTGATVADLRKALAIERIVAAA
jgi:hypothetical protein